MRVLVTKKIDNKGIDLLRASGHDVEIVTEQNGLSHNALVEKIRLYQPHALISMLTDSIDSEILNASETLAIVANYAVGFNNIDTLTAVQKRIFVTNTPDVLTESVAEFTFALMLAVGRHILPSDEFVKSGSFNGWQPDSYLGIELRGVTLGLLGVGRIGSRVAEIARNGFGMNVCYFDVTRNEALERSTGALFCAKKESVLSNADVISIHVPLTNDTRGMISNKEFQIMKRTAILINTARGPVINESALAEALQAERIAGAGIDVFEYEPEVNALLKTCKNAVLTPHIGSATERARSEMSRLAAENILQAFRGIVPQHAVNTNKKT